MRSEIAEARKPAKLVPKFAQREGSEAATIVRFKTLRDLVLSATPVVIDGRPPPRSPEAVLFPPFDLVWIEWAERYYKAGVHVRFSPAVGMLSATAVVSGRNRTSFYDQPDVVYLDDAGRFNQRDAAAAARWLIRHAHERRAFEVAYDAIAHINSGAVVGEVDTGRYRVLTGEERDDISVVVVDIRLPRIRQGSIPRENDTVRPLHEVRGHVRRQKSGSVSWVRPHTRGDAKNGTHIASYRLHASGGEGVADTDAEKSPGG